MSKCLPSCCEYHSKQLPNGCNGGRLCPAREPELNGWDKAMLLVAVLGSTVVIGVWFFGGV